MPPGCGPNTSAAHKRNGPTVTARLGSAQIESDVLPSARAENYLDGFGALGLVLQVVEAVVAVAVVAELAVCEAVAISWERV